MPRVEYSPAELQSLGLHKPRRRLSPSPRIKLKKPALPPVVWMLALAVALSAATLTVHQPVTIMGQSGASSTVIESNGLVAQTSLMPDGRQTTLKVQNFGWPISYHTFSCYGVAPECKNSSQFKPVLIIVNLLVWFLLVVIFRMVYIAIKPFILKQRRK